MTGELVALVAVGFIAQLVDGALGMAFGLVSTTALLALGVPPAQASAAVHTAEIATTGLSGLAHHYYRNIDRRLFLTLAASGMTGGVLGAYLLSNIDSTAVRPLIACYLLAMGVLILTKAIRGAVPSSSAGPGRVVPLGLIGGFLDATGGGGWGAIVTSTLIGSGRAPRTVIGSVNAAEFVVTVAVSTTFFIELGTAHTAYIAALVTGGILAAPFGGLAAKHIPARSLMALVGVVVSLLALVQLVRSVVSRL